MVEYSKNFPASSSDSSKPIITGAAIKGDTGLAPVVAIPQPWHLAIPCDADGTNEDLTYAFIDMSILQGNSILGEVGSVNGWTMTIPFVADCTVTPSGLRATVTSIADDWATFTAQFDKTGYTPVTVKVVMSKIHKGETGTTGATGSQGIQGIQGLQGNTGTPGTGLVILKRLIKVKGEENILITNDGAGKILCTMDTAPRDVELGEYLLIGSQANNDPQLTKVTGLVSTDAFTVDANYVADDAQATYFSWWHFRNFANSTEQLLKFPDFLPVGAKRDEIAVEKTAGTLAILFWDAGLQPYPSAGYSAYMNGVSIAAAKDTSQVNLWDPNRSGYTPRFIAYGTDPARNLYIRARLYGTSYQWATWLADNEWNLFYSYKFFDTDYTAPV